MPESRRHFARRVEKALDDPNLQRALTSGLTGIRGRRDQAFKTFDFAKGQAELKQRRRANLKRLPELVGQFKERLEAAGGVVHYAKNAAEAREIIGQICSNAGGASKRRMVVTKVKSMASEEIELNPYLEGLGMEVVETDLGEFILQLDGDAPSHIVTPMIHKDRHAVARAFVRELGAAYTAEPRELTMIAREATQRVHRRVVERRVGAA